MPDLFSPFIEIRVGNAQVRNLFAGLDLWLSRKEPADVCEFSLNIGLPELGLAKDVSLEIWIGYDLGQAWKVFSGYVTEARAPRFLCKDEGIKLFRTQIIQTFLGVTPQEIIRFGLGKAGISSMNLDHTVYPRKDRFVAAGENVSDLVRRVNTTWGISHDWYFAGQTFNWQPLKPQPGPVYSYQYGANIIDLEFFTDREPLGQRPAGSTSGAGKLTTVVSPWISHSQEVEIIWPEITNTRFIVETVRHYLNNNNILRSDIYFRELEAT